MSAPRTAAVGALCLAFGLPGSGRLLARATSHRQAQVASPASDAAPRTVYRPNTNGVTLPKLRHEVKPQYTWEALRERVAGAVLLECVVDEKGRVESARVARSLDPVHGLDDEAIKAAKRWQFDPGLKDGVPVAVLITIEMTFTVGTRPLDSRLPAGFAGEAPPDDAEWAEHTADASGIAVRLRLPPGWTTGPTGNPDTLMAAHADNGRKVLRIERPAAISGDLRNAIPADALRRISEQIKHTYEIRYPHARFVGSGQGTIGSSTWIWAEVIVPEQDVAATMSAAPNSAQASAAPSGASSGDAHIWTFYTTQMQQQIAVACIHVVQTTGMPNQRAADDAAAAREFSEIIRRTTIGVHR